MFIVHAKAGFNVRKAWQRVVPEVGEELADSGNVCRVNAKSVRWIAHRLQGTLLGRRTGGVGRVVAEVLLRITETRKSSRRELVGRRGVGITAVIVQAIIVSDRIVDFPGNGGGIKLLKNGCNGQRAKLIIL